MVLSYVLESEHSCLPRYRFLCLLVVTALRIPVAPLLLESISTSPARPQMLMNVFLQFSIVLFPKIKVLLSHSTCTVAVSLLSILFSTPCPVFKASTMRHQWNRIRPTIWTTLNLELVQTQCHVYEGWARADLVTFTKHKKSTGKRKP